MVNTMATRPYTAMLFIEYLMSEEGFKPWGINIGAYSPNPNFTVNEGDLPIDVWKTVLIMEDSDYILENFEVEDFILLHCQN
jgi:iron(III) transport system substrate-binding protein